MLHKLLLGVLLCGSLLLTGTGDASPRKIEIFAVLRSVNEVPTTLSTTGRATVKATIDQDAQTIKYELSYSNVEGGDVQQAHFHLGQRHTTGNVVIFLCTNLGNSPTAPACPASPGTVSGTLTAADITGGAAAAGLPAGAFAEVVGLLRSGNMYANVHTTNFPAGEIRGQVHEVRFDGNNDDDWSSRR